MRGRHYLFFLAIDYMNYTIFVGLASIPGREYGTVQTINSILQQSLLPAKIILTVCYTYTRFPNKTYNTDIIRKYINNPLLEIYHSEIDYGPISKLFGVIDNISTSNKNTFIVLIDDDLFYKPYMLQTFYDNINNNPSNAYSFWTYHNPINNCMVGEGSAGFAINATILGKIKNYYHDCISYDKRLYYQDDLIISTYLAFKKCPIIFLLPVNRTFANSVMVYIRLPSTFKYSLLEMTNELSRQQLNNIFIPPFLNPNIDSS